MALSKSGEQLEVSAAEYRALLDHLPVGAYLGPLDETASTSYISHGIVAMLGYSRREWMEDRDFWPTIIHPGDRARVLAEHAHHMSTHEPFISEYRLLAKDGRVVWVRDEASVIL